MSEHNDEFDINGNYYWHIERAIVLLKEQITKFFFENHCILSEKDLLKILCKRYCFYDEQIRKFFEVIQQNHIIELHKEKDVYLTILAPFYSKEDLFQFLPTAIYRLWDVSNFKIYTKKDYRKR